MERKICKKCNQDLPIENFKNQYWKGKKLIDNICKKCSRERDRNTGIIRVSSGNEFKCIKCSLIKSKLYFRILEDRIIQPCIDCHKSTKLNNAKTSFTNTYYQNKYSDSNKRWCKHCSKLLDSNNFGSFPFLCLKCMAQLDHTKRTNKKIWAINYLGNSCLDCGFSDGIQALHFHHLTNKSFSISRNINISQERLKLELDKCVLLCSNCHRLRHRQAHSISSKLLEKRLWALDKTGNICARCLLLARISNEAIFDLHHVIENIKSNSNIYSSWKLLKHDINYCVSLCSNCHHIIHYKGLSLDKFYIGHPNSIYNTL